jgi:hypothetical protein
MQLLAERILQARGIEPESGEDRVRAAIRAISARSRT